MNIFDHLGKIYNEIDATYKGIEDQARSNGYNKKEAEYNYKRQLNDQAYFLFMFSRLEDRVRNLSDKLINNKVRNLSDWNIKRAWEIIAEEKDLYFMKRVALLTPKGHTDYNLIKLYYDQRNKIAHGGVFTIVISIRTVISDTKRLYRDLNI